MLKSWFSIGIALILAACASAPDREKTSQPAARKIGVVYVVHGGSEEAGPRSSWESTLQIFVYDPNSAVYRGVIWNAERWPQILAAGNAPKELAKYAFSYERIGGQDPADGHTEAVFEQFRAQLEAREAELGVDFIVDQVSWLAPTPSQHAFPRLIYEPRVPGGSRMTFCDVSWKDCNPERYNVDGTIERMLAAGVSEIHMIDLTTSGVRFFKSWDVVNLSREVVARHNAQHGTSVTVRWANDPTDLMTASYPADESWTLSKGEPKSDRKVPLAGRPNPVSSDPLLAQTHQRGISAKFNSRVPASKTGVLLVNHATREGNRWFDPKINDTLILNANIEKELLAKHPDLAAENIVGAWFGRRQVNPKIAPKPPTFSQLERTREMRGENLGDAYLYETSELPDGKWGYVYWEALEKLKSQGVEHIVVAFPQIMVDSVLNLVEVPNQIAKEIGFRTWAQIDTLDKQTYPTVGHPFADYWGIWVDKQCPARKGAGTEPCCFVLGGCADGRAYPAVRTTPLDKARDDLDPSLAYDVAEYGHLGYDPAKGAPRNDAPVQGQYRGTWAMWQPPNRDPDVARLLANHVIDSMALKGPSIEPVPLHRLQ